MRLFYLEPDGTTVPQAGDDVVLSETESRHLLKVNRARQGDAVQLTDGLGRFFDTRLTAETGRLARLTVGAVHLDPLETAEPRLVLACGVVKGKRFEDVLEKAVELGAQRIVPLLTDHAEVDPGAGRVSRWRTLLITAMKQSGRSWLPQLETPVGLSAFLAADPSAALYYGLARSRRGNPDDDTALLTPQRLFSGGDFPADCASIVWLVGPEGGWSTDEVSLLGSRAAAVRLGPYRLRTATACLAGLTLLGPMRESILRKER